MMGGSKEQEGTRAANLALADASLDRGQPTLSTKLFATETAEDL